MNREPQQAKFAEKYKLFVGFDFAKNAHHAVAVDPAGKVSLRLGFPNTAEGWAEFRQKLLDCVGADLAVAAVTIETSHGWAVERLLDMGCHVYPVNPKAAERFRDRKAPSGAKDDDRDAYSLADALRTDGENWRRLHPDDALTQELRLVCRDEVSLIHQRTALACKLQQALYEYYPAALEAFDEWTSEGAWAFVQTFPTPQDLARKGKRQWEKFLHVHRLYRPETYPRRMEIFARATEFCGAEGVTRAKSRLAVALVGQLRLLEKQLQEYRATILALFEKHPDRDLFGSLPGAGGKIAPRLLTEMGSDRDRFQDAQALQCYVGTAPVTRQSGKGRWVKLRRACNKQFRTTVHLWANLSRSQCAWAEAYYRTKVDEGKSHACALRCLGQRWLKILHAMYQSGQPYDETLHTRNQLLHGTWKLTPR